MRPNSEQVSREHAEFAVKADQVVVRDLGSRNGTLVNNKVLTAPCPLKDRDLIQVGPLTFAISIEATPVAAAKEPRNEGACDCTRTAPAKAKAKRTFARRCQQRRHRSLADRRNCRQPDPRSSLGGLRRRYRPERIKSAYRGDKGAKPGRTRTGKPDADADADADAGCRCRDSFPRAGRGRLR